MELPDLTVSWSQLGLLGTIFLFAFAIKGLVGYGAVPAIIVLGSHVVSPHHVVLLAAISNLVSHVQFVPEGWRHGDRRLSFWLALFFIPTVAFGIWMFTRLDGDRLSIVSGVLIITLLLLETSGLMRRFEPVIQRHRRISGPIAASACGLISGFIGVGAIVFISAYIRMFCPTRQTFRATVFLVAGLLAVYRSTVLIASGVIGADILLQALILAPAAYLGGVAGSALSRRLSNERFFAVYRALLLAGGASLIWRGLPL